MKESYCLDSLLPFSAGSSRLVATFYGPLTFSYMLPFKSRQMDPVESSCLLAQSPNEAREDRAQYRKKEQRNVKDTFRVLTIRNPLVAETDA